MGVAKRGRYAFTVRAWEDGLFAEYYYLLPDEDAKSIFREGSHPVLSFPVREELRERLKELRRKRRSEVVHGRG